MTRSLLLLLACLTALPVLGAGPLDALRAQSRAARDEVTALRAQQLSRRNELSALSARIETLKAQSKGRLLPGGELDAALKQSQELSGSLSTLAGQLSTREQALETTNLSLLDALSAELGRLRAEFDRAADRQVRAQLIEAMRRVRGERDALRQSLPATRVPSVDLKPSDDPEELLEQADRLRDSEEKLRRDLKALESRIAERRDEADLDRHVQRFMGEESMFDDGDRRLRVRQTTTTSSTAPLGNPATDTNTSANEGAQQTSAAPETSTSVGSGGPNPPATGLFDGVSPAFGPSPGANEARGGDGQLDPASIRVTNGSDARLQAGNVRAGLNVDLDGDLKHLEAEKARLQGLAGQLSKKAAELEKRAAELE